MRERVPNHRLLGLHVNNHLTWNTHVAHLCCKEKLYDVKKAHSPLSILNRHQECNGVQRHGNTSYIYSAITK